MHAKSTYRGASTFILSIYDIIFFMFLNKQHNAFQLGHTFLLVKYTFVDALMQLIIILNFENFIFIENRKYITCKLQFWWPRKWHPQKFNVQFIKKWKLYLSMRTNTAVKSINENVGVRLSKQLFSFFIGENYSSHGVVFVALQSFCFNALPQNGVNRKYSYRKHRI